MTGVMMIACTHGSTIQSGTTLARWAVDMWLPRRPAFPLQERVDRVSRVWVPITILIALWTFVCWLIFGPQPSFTRALLMGISVLIIAYEQRQYGAHHKLARQERDAFAVVRTAGAQRVTGARAYGVLVCLFESALPQAMREPYFEVTGVIITLVLFARCRR